MATGRPRSPAVQRPGLRAFAISRDSPGEQRAAVFAQSRQPATGRHHWPVHRRPAQLFYAPGLGRIDDEVLGWMQRADCLLLDGTLWRDDEMRLCEVGQSLGSEMGHLAQSGPGGMLEVLEGFNRQRKVLIHINNTNPILDEDSAERALLERRGIEVAYDGMSIEL